MECYGEREGGGGIFWSEVVFIAVAGVARITNREEQSRGKRKEKT